MAECAELESHVEPGDGHGLRQYRLSQRRPGEGGGIEARKRMERVAFHIRPLHRGVEKAEIESRVVPDQDGAPAIVGTYPCRISRKNALQGVALRERRAQRVKWIDARHGE